MKSNNYYDESPVSLALRLKQYVFFLLVLSVLFAGLSINSDFLIAPPYAVTAYMVVFQNESRYTKILSIVSTYLLVIASSYLIHIVIGNTLIAMISNLVLVSAFITFTDYIHPPALALTVFSYIIHDQLGFTESSLIALIVIVTTSIAIKTLRLKP